jgi:hypothetical protein
MFRNRLFYAFVVLAFGLLVFFTVWDAAATASVVESDRSYDALEAQRLERPLSTIDRNYDRLETLRSQRSNDLAADRSYDLIEVLRVKRSNDLAADRSYELIKKLRATGLY